MRGRRLWSPARARAFCLGIWLWDTMRCIRERLASLIWPEKDHCSAMQGLREEIYELRQLLGAARDALVGGRGTIGLSSEHLDLDLAR